jgi:micrococcal nuclease
MPPRRRRARRAARQAPKVLPPLIRRRSTRWLVAAVLTLAVGLLIGRLSGAGGGGDGNSTPAPTPLATSPAASATSTVAPAPSLAFTLPPIHPDPASLERASIVHIVDGDTIDVELNGKTERVRYYGIDTPERGQRCFSEATDRNAALAGQTVLLLPDARERDRYDRLLRYVFSANGDSIDERLIAEGYAHAWTQDGVYRDTLVTLEDQTHAAAIGCLWK